MARPEYPKDMREFRRKFATEAACIEYLIQCRWPEGFVCPKCSGNVGTRLSTRPVIECRGCHYQVSPMAGTVMHRSKISIPDWFAAAYHVATFTPGISAHQLQRQLGFRSKDTAWYLLHRLRKGMVSDTRTKISGLIEADETFIGGTEKGKRGRGAGNKSLVVGAVEVLVYEGKNGERCERAGRLRLALIPDATEESLEKFFNDYVEPKSRIRTDGWRGYSDAALADFVHYVRIVRSGQLAHKRFPHIHKVFGNLKTWLNGTHHGVLPKYLPSYLDEFVFRFNRRKTPMAAFQTLLGISLQKKPLTLGGLRN
jgi:transposase-like protein